MAKRTSRDTLEELEKTTTMTASAILQGVIRTVNGTKDWGVKTPPDFKSRKVFILPGPFFSSAVAFFARAGWQKAESIEDARLVVFLGGSDINPSLYGQKAIHGVRFSEDRDLAEKAVYEKCLELDIPMMGICRGAQLLHALNGGKLWQHVDNHSGANHYILDIEEDIRVLSNSYHHQMLRMNDEMTLIAVTEEPVASHFVDQDLHINTSNIRADQKPKQSAIRGHNGDLAATLPLEIEAASYEKTKCILFQGHPEDGEEYYASWVMHKLHDFLEAVETTRYRDFIQVSVPKS